jgi:hypothetical protein
VWASAAGWRFRSWRASWSDRRWPCMWFHCPWSQWWEWRLTALSAQARQGPCHWAGSHSQENRPADMSFKGSPCRWLSLPHGDNRVSGSLGFKAIASWNVRRSARCELGRRAHSRDRDLRAIPSQPGQAASCAAKCP